MADLNYMERRLLEDLLGMGTGYVLDFTDATYQDFFRDFGINIEHQQYHKRGRSKAKRMRTFWETAPNEQVGKVLDGLFDYIEKMQPQESGGPVEDKHRAISARLLGRQAKEEPVAQTENEFLRLEFGKLDLSRLALEPAIEATIRQRIEEIHQCLVNQASLAAVLLSGSTLEGLLLDIASKNPKAFNSAKAAPTDDGKVRQFQEWTLNDFVNVAHEVGLLSLDVKKYSHALRDFRNYIHPFQQAHSHFQPDKHTARISWQVLQAAIADLTSKRNH